MSRPLLLLLGLLAIVVLMFFCVRAHRGPIEADLGGRAAGALAAAGLGDVEVSLAGRDVTLTGRVPDAAARARAVDAAGVDGVRAIDDRLRVAGAGAAPETGGAEDARAVPEAGGAEDARAEAPVARGATAADLRVVASRRGEGVVLEGVVPEAARDVLVARARELAGPEGVTDRIEVAGVSGPEGFAGGLLAALPHVLRLRNGRAVEAAGRLELSGLTEDPEESGRLRTELAAAVPPGYEVEVDVATEIAPEACQSGVDSLLAGETILFASGSDRIAAESEPLLGRIASILRRCPDLRLRIEGHTDSQGDEGSNLELSEQRAAAVELRLVARGMPPERAETEGFGESRPVADNETAEGRAKNRRIEFELEGAT